MVKNPSANVGDKKRCGFYPWVGKIPWKRSWQPIPVFLPREFHEQRSLVGYIHSMGRESGMTEKTWHTCTVLSTEGRRASAELYFGCGESRVVGVACT